METEKVYLKQNEIHLGLLVRHDLIYDGNEQMKVVGLRNGTVELQGDYSGGTHNVCQDSWIPIDGTFRLRKVCDEIAKNGTCTLHNIHCSYPNCSPFI